MLTLLCRCIQGVLRKKPRILVTHQLQYLTAADSILILNEVGRILLHQTCPVTRVESVTLGMGYLPWKHDLPSNQGGVSDPWNGLPAMET